MKKSILLRLSFVIVLAFLATYFTVLYIFRSKAIEDAKGQAHTISELVRDTLTSYMVMGVMDRRDEFLHRIREVDSIEDVRVIRGRSVIEQFGSGRAFEMPRGEIERAVLESGKPVGVLRESLKEVKYKLVIPYKAEPMKGINCLQCHKAQPGEVLGALSLTINLTKTRKAHAELFLVVFIVFSLIFLPLFLFVNNFLAKLVDFIKKVTEAVKVASEGDFKYELRTDLGHEPRLLNQTLDQSFSKLHKAFSSMEDKIMAIIGYSLPRTGNALYDTSRIVDELLNIYRFKRALEKDRTREDVYERIRQILEDYMSLEKFSFYDVERKKVKIKAIYVRGAKNWCKDIIFEKAGECRAVRTGMDVDSREFPCVCPNFIDQEACREGRLYHYCIPVYIGGAVQYVVQVVYEPEMEPFIKLIIPYIKSYLEEAAPILEARTYMDILREQSLRDQLTGLYNRRFLDETIDKISAQINRRGTILGILMVDVDYFKEINDTYGHDIGDRVLKEVANILLKSVRQSDIVVRFGGEEFMVLLVDVERGRAEDIAEKIRRVVENHPIETSMGALKKTISIGVSEFPMDSDKIWQCVKFADVALYKAKEFGRNRVVRFKPEFWKQEHY
ncbi:MAG: GGDEF domain-containing protein [Aquificaceae bacterium]